MKKLYLLQALSLGLYIGGSASNIGLFLMIQKVFSLQLPSILLIYAVLLIIPISATIRIIAYIKRKDFLRNDEFNRLGPKIYFSTAIVEIIVFIIGVGFALAS